MKRSVFVTGGSGLLGVTWAATARGERDVTLALHTRQVSLRNVRTRTTNLDSLDDLSRAFDGVGLVVHTAGMTNVEACEKDPARARHVNVELAGKVADACAKSGSRLAHISTDHLFGDAGMEPVSEADPVSPTNVYGETKAAAEVRVLERLPSALVVRTNFYGWGPRYRPSFSDRIVGALRAGQPIKLFTDVFYSPILMEPLIRAVHELVDRDAAGIYHVSGDDHVSKHEFGVRVASAFGLDPALIVPAPIAGEAELVRRPHRMRLSNRKASALLGRRMGGIEEHLAALQSQEQGEAAKEISGL